MTAAILAERRSYVAGRWVEGDHALAVENPADETTVAELGVTPMAEVERAIAAARASFDQGVWADRTAAERARVLHALLDHIEGARDELVPTMVAEAGQPVNFADGSQLQAGVALARDTIDLYLSMRHEDFNPVPVDELVQGRVRAEHAPARTGRRRRRDHAVQRGAHHGVPEARCRP